MSRETRHKVHVRSADHVERLAVALVREEVFFDVRPEPNGWWLIRATIPFANDLFAIEQATRLAGVGA